MMERIDHLERVPAEPLFGPAPASCWHNAAMSDARQMQRAPVDGGHVEYMLHGSGDPMLFIHGAGIADAFAPLINRPPWQASSRFTTGVAATDRARLPEDRLRASWRGRRRMRRSCWPISASVRRTSLDTRAARSSHWILRARRLRPCGHWRCSSRHCSGVPSTGPHMAALTPAVERFAAGDRAGAIDGLFSVVFGPGWRPDADLAVPGGAEQAESDAATFFESELPGVGAWQFDSRRAAQVQQPVLFMMGSATVLFHQEAGERIVSGGQTPSDTWFPAQPMRCRSSSLTTWRRDSHSSSRVTESRCDGRPTSSGRLSSSAPP